MWQVTCRNEKFEDWDKSEHVFEWCKEVHKKKEFYITCTHIYFSYNKKAHVHVCSKNTMDNIKNTIAYSDL